MLVATSGPASAETVEPTSAATCTGSDCYVTFWNNGTGSGQVVATSDRAETAVCRPAPSCRHFFYGLVIVVRAVPDPATSYFAGWDGCYELVAGDDAACVIDTSRYDALCPIFMPLGVTAPPPGSCPPPVPPAPPPPPDTTPPDTRITSAPSRTRSRRATFRFRSNELGSIFFCKLDGRGWLPCRSPKTYRRLKVGLHTFRVRAIDKAGNVERTPATKRWRIIR